MMQLLFSLVITAQERELTFVVTLILLVDMECLFQLHTIHEEGRSACMEKNWAVSAYGILVLQLTE